MRMTQKKLISNPEHRAMYIKWKDDPITLAVQDIIRTESTASLRMIPANLINESSAEMMLGQQAGSQWAADRMTNIDEYKATEELLPTYGAEQYLEEYGLAEENDNE